MLLTFHLVSHARLMSIANPKRKTLVDTTLDLNTDDEKTLMQGMLARMMQEYPEWKD